MKRHGSNTQGGAPSKPRRPRHGARQPERFDPADAALLDDPERFDYLPPKRVIELLDPPAGALVVDYGAGTGTYAIAIARARPDVTVVAYDEQAQMLKRLAAKPEASLPNLRMATPEQFAERRGRADRVLALNVLHELGDRALKELAALPSASGFVLLIDWNAGVERPVGPPREHTYDSREAVKRLQAVGLRVEELKPMRYHFVLRARG